MRAVDHRWEPFGPPYQERPTDRHAACGGPDDSALDALGVPPHLDDTVPQVERLLALAQWSAGIVLPDCGERARAVGPVLERLADARRRGLVIRLLCGPDALAGEMSRDLQHNGLASVTRVTATGAEPVVIVDGSVAFVPAHGPATVRGPAVVRVFEALFAGAWTTAVPLADHDRLCHRTRSEVTLGVLRRLGAGLADDAGAREMSVSLRTYRRHVAELMEALEADSRFQAGARAVALGLTSCYGR